MKKEGVSRQGTLSSYTRTTRYDIHKTCDLNRRKRRRRRRKKSHSLSINVDKKIDSVDVRNATTSEIAFFTAVLNTNKPFGLSPD